MSGMTLIFAGEQPDTPLRWVILDAEGGMLKAEEGDWSALSSRASGKLVLAVPGTRVTAHQLPITSRSERQARDAAPFAAEDLIASDLDDVHVALQPAERSGDSDSGLRLVFIATLADMNGWTGAARSAGLVLDSVVPDYWLLPVLPQRLHHVAYGARTLMRADGWGGAVDEQSTRELMPAISEMRGLSPYPFDGDDAGLLEAMASAAAHTGPGLLTGSFAPSNSDAAATRNLPWRLAAASAVMVAMLATAQNLVIGAGLSREAANMRSEVEQRFRALYPDAASTRNLRAQIRERGARTGAGQPEFLLLSASLSGAISEDPSLDLDYIRFDAASGEMISSVFYDDYESFAAFRSRLEAQGVVFDEGGSQQAGRRRVGNFSVSVRS